MKAARIIVAILLVIWVSFLVGCSTSPTETVGATSGSGQNAQVGAAFSNPLVVTVTKGGSPVSGVTVTFSAPASGASCTLSGNPATTNSSGVASATCTANTKAGAYTVTASISGASGTASFNMTNTAAAAASIAATSGSGQSAAINTQFTNPFVATVYDTYQNPVPNVSVTYAAQSSNGASCTLGATSATTNSSGQTSTTCTANSTVGGPYTVTATVSGLAPATFANLNNLAPPPVVTATGGTPQSATVNTAFANALVVYVSQAGSPLSGVTVTFTPPGSGASGTFAGGVNTATTDVNGVATSAAFTANTVAGTYTVAATVPQATSPANFTLTNTAGAAASIGATSGSGQSATVSTAFKNPLVATVLDQYSNPVSGVTVTFTAPSSGASGTFKTTGTDTEQDTTGANGQASSSTFTANATAGGPYTVAATVSGVGTPADFSLTNTASQQLGCTGTTLNGELNGSYAFLLNGWSGSGPSTAVSWVGSFAADGNGNITGGQLDKVDQANTNGDQHFTLGTSTYCVQQSNNLAIITLAPTGGSSVTFAASVYTAMANNAGYAIEYDSTHLLMSGLIRGPQDTNAFKTSALNGDYALGMVGADKSANRFASAGVVSIDGNGNVCPSGGSFTCEYDNDDGGVASNGTINPSTYSVDSTGRGTASIVSSIGTTKMVFYVVNSSEFLMMEADVSGSTPMIQAGDVEQQSGSFTTLTGSLVYETQGYSSAKGVQDQVGVASVNGTALTVELDENDSGTLTTQLYTPTYSVASNGRMTLTGAGQNPPVFYFYGQNKAFVVGTDGTASFGMVTGQSATSFTNTALSGYYLGGSQPPTTDGGGVSVTSLDINNANQMVSGNNFANGGQSGSFSASYCTASWASGSSDNLCTSSSNGRVQICGSISGTSCQSMQGIVYIISDTQFVYMDASGENEFPGLADFLQRGEY